MTVKKIDIPISMLERSDCDDCVSRFRQQVAHLEGVIDASPNVAAGTVRLSYDSSILDIDELRSRAEQIGIDLESRFGHETLRLEGMHCADCARSIVAVAERQPGVVSANASFASSTLRVEYERQRADMGRLVRQIEQLGYPVAGRGAPPAKREWLTSRTALSAASGAALVLGLVAEYAGSGRADLFYGAACALAAPYLLKGAFAALRARVVETDFLMAAAAAGAIYLGDWREAAAVVFLYTLGETLEGLSVARARRAIRALAEGFPAFCSVLEDGVEREVRVEDVQPGQVVIVRPGQMTPVDGRVASGASEVDESLVTGESVPVSKEPGDAVIAGSLNGSGSLQVLCERASADNTVNRIVAMVEEAQGQRSPSERTSERFGRVYTPVVLVTAAALAVGGPLVAGQAFDESFRRALVLLTVSCPCALILSAPVAVVSAIAAAASSGVLIKGGAALEALGRTRTLALDKTGTVTLGRLQVTDVAPISPATREQLLQVAASLEAHSEHVVARAVSEYAREAGVKTAEVSDFLSHAGKGVAGTLDGRRALVGSAALMNENGLADERVEAEVERFARSGKITLVAAHGDDIVGIIALSDEVRPEAADVVAKVRGLGIAKVTLLTGDRPEAAGTIASLVGVSAVSAGLKPEDKLAEIANMSDASGAVAMVGDGINDAPALARADVGISIGSAATATRQAADVVLLGGDLTGLPYALELGQKALTTIRANLAFSVLVVLTLVGLTLAGRLTLTQGVLGHEGSSLAVVANGLRLLGRRRKTEREKTGDHRHHEHQEGRCSSG